MRALNRSMAVLLAAASSFTLSGCLGTNTPAPITSLFYESASGTSFTAQRSAGFEDMAVANGNTGTIGTGGNSGFTAFTNSGTGAYGLTMLVPADTTDNTGGTTIDSGAFTATLTNGGFATVASGVFAGAAQSSTTTPLATFEANVTPATATGDVILVDKFGQAQGLQDSEYGVWNAVSGASITAGLSTAAVSDAGVFAVGTPTTIMPTTGSATYTGGAAGVVTTGATGGEFAGVSTLSANFATGTITGTVSGSSTNTTAAIPFAAAGSSTVTGSINPISFTAGTIAGNTFAGTAQSVAATGGAPTVSTLGAATGSFGGQFNGLNAAEVAGTFKITGGGNSIIGSYGAKQ